MDSVALIPQLLHRVWICPPGPSMPAEFVRYGEQFAALHPSWSCRDWDRINDLVPLINEELYANPPRAHFHRCRADVVRLEAVYRYGGIYVDTDVEPVRPLDPLLIHLHSIQASAFVVWSPNKWQGRSLVSNAVIGAAPNHPWIRRAIDELPRSVERHAGKFLALQTVHYLTDLLGPLNTLGVSAEGVAVLPSATFYPRSISERRQGQAVRVSPETFAIHHWANSRKKS